MDEAFVKAHAAVDAHDVDGLQALLDDRPDLVGARGDGNRNTLLGMATATCDERLVDLLLERGAPVDGANVHGWTPLHQAAYVNLPHLARRLLGAGADPARSARGDGGTPLVVALFWGHRRVVDEVLLGTGVLPPNLRAAAGVGDLGAVDGDPGAHRAYYRPHSGFPEWAPSDDRQEVLDEALAYASRNDRAAVLAELVQRGARLEADVYRGTPLVWAAFTGALGAVRTLLGLGADPSGRGSFGGADHGAAVTPLHLAGSGGHADVVRVLLEAGADAAVVDGHGYGTPAGWAEHGGHPQVAALIRAAV